ncbi:conserved hypothetical CheR like methyltransferase protein [Candidatus Vecturithrix granuli]|uniref:protein-glutamate O-methyltransferase n=1 Tax=Vecturithrix granuli TaxID=1499967 RepID=A0A081C2C8_VECG1|nr:conserved hypothetical CheR like methyltransferase protein [Candidatus Vecturithrix granuli]
MPKTQKHETPAEQPAESPPMESAQKPQTQSFPIVGIGASAGGLEALEQFFTNMPGDSHIAFVIIQHLSPKHKSIMGELLQKRTTMQVFEVQDGMTIAPDCIYLNPPDKQVIIIDNTLQLLESVKTQGIHLPIDTFFRSLSEDQGEKAICIVLSGTGSDGTQGLKAIKGAGGMTMVQDEHQAKYDGMPRSAIDSGQVDYVLPVENMPAELLKYVQHSYIEGPAKTSLLTNQFQNYASKIFALIRSQTGHDFSHYKQTTILRRIERRMAVHQIDRLTDYLHYLQQTSAEVDILFKEMLIGVTNFFRDPEAFAVLADQVLPSLLTRKPSDMPLRVWTPGCSTGEEAYSIAILLAELMEQLNKHLSVQIFASDLDAEAIDFARSAVYPESIAADVSSQRLQRFFIKEENTYQVKKQIRDMVVFAVQNLVKDPPFSRLDLICCRNLLIYMDAALQKQLFPLFHYTLVPDGVLFLGPSESIGEFTDLFRPLNTKWKFFARRETKIAEMYVSPAMPFFERRTPPSQEIRGNTPSPGIDLRRLTEKIALEHYTLPCVLLNERSQILYTIGAVDRYLRLTPGEPNFNIVQMAREGLRYKLSAAIQKATKLQTTVVVQGLRVKQNGDYCVVDITVRPLAEPTSAPGFLLVVFEEQYVKHCNAPGDTAQQEKEMDPRVMSLEQELQSTKEYLQTMIEELETSNEELKSMNEELQSVNEELQSTNEELETSKEELQSTNEELMTVNTELQHKVEELSRSNSDINNLLASTDIGTIFLDCSLRIKRFTPSMAKIFNLIQSDVGRPMSDITSTIDNEQLYQDAKEVLDTLIRKEQEILTKNGAWYSIRIMPYRTVENVIDGVVMSFVDVSQLKQAEIAERDARIYTANMIEVVREPLLLLDADLRVRAANTVFYRTFQMTPESMLNKHIYDAGDRQWDIPELRTFLEEIIPHNTTFEDYKVEYTFPTTGTRTIRLNARRIEQEGRRPHLILLTIEVTPHE